MLPNAPPGGVNWMKILYHITNGGRGIFFEWSGKGPANRTETTILLKVLPVPTTVVMLRPVPIHKT